MGSGKQLLIKFVLILFSEAAAIMVTDLVSNLIVPIKHTAISYIVCGAALAYLVVLLYDKYLEKRRSRLNQELQNLTDLALMRYNVQDRE
jgi:positive regulator of sigma E activity